MDLVGLAAFNLVATHGGFGRASRASGEPKATLSRRVRELEESLGVRLIERGSQALRLTEDGATIHARTEGLLGEIAEVGQDVVEGGGRPRGRLRVSAPLFFAHVTLGRLSAGFVAAYPEVQLEVTTEDRFVNLIEHGYDLVIRVNPRPENDLVGRCFLKDRLVLIAPPSMPRPRQARGGEAPQSFPAVMRAGIDTPTVWTVVDGDRTKTYHPKPVMWSSAPILARDAVRAGAGAALVPRSVAAEDMAQGRLVCWGVAKDSHIEAWVLHASRRLVSPKVAAFMRYLCEFFTEISF